MATRKAEKKKRNNIIDIIQIIFHVPAVHFLLDCKPDFMCNC